MAASACTLLAIGAASSVVVQPATRHAAVRGVRMSTTGQDASASSPALSKWSAAVPFLSRPAKLDGSMVGDCGFDPAGLSEIDGEYINLKWMREAEIKHGRVAMLATAGWLAVDFGFKLPGDKYAGLTSLNAHGPMVESGDMVLMLLAVAFVEATFGAKIFQPGHTPGAYGWDPLDMGKEDSEAALKELKNGRLAMIAFSGIVTQAALTGSGFPYV